MPKVNTVAELFAEYNQGKRDFQNSDLTGANLQGAYLSGVNLTGAKLAKADLSEANLSQAILIRADLTSALLYRANLTQANLSNAILKRAILQNTNLQKSYLLRADLSGAVLLQANLQSARLREANLSNTNLTGANLKQANLTEVNYNYSTIFPEDFPQITATNVISSHYPIPIDPHNIAGWNYFWKTIIDRGETAEFFRDFFDDSGLVIPLLQETKAKTILCVGNGLSLEPYLLALARFQVTVLDISDYVNQYLRNYPVTTKSLEHFTYFSQYYPHLVGFSTQDSEKMREIKWVTGSLFTVALNPAKFDVIITRKTLQCFNFIAEEKPIEAMKKLLNHLTPTGLLVYHGHNSYDINNRLKKWLQEQNIPVSEDLRDKLNYLHQVFVWIRETSG